MNFEDYQRLAKIYRETGRVSHFLLNYAIKFGDVEIVKNIRFIGTNQRYNFVYPLSEAINANSGEIIRLILNTGRVDPLSFYYAVRSFAESGNITHFHLMLENVKAEYSFSAIVEYSRHDLLDIMIDKYKEDKSVLHWHFQAFLIKACNKRNIDFVRKLTNLGIFSKQAFLSCNCFPELLPYFLQFEEKNDYIEPFLVSCIRYKNSPIESVEIISEFIKLDQRGLAVYPLLFDTVFITLVNLDSQLEDHKLSYDKIMILLKKLDINIRYKDNCIFCLLAERHHYSSNTFYSERIIDYLIDNFDFNYPGMDDFGNSPIMISILKYNMGMLKIVIKMPNINHKNHSGESILDIFNKSFKRFCDCSSKQRIEDFKNIFDLISHPNYDVSITDSQGNDFMMLAQMYEF